MAVDLARLVLRLEAESAKLQSQLDSTTRRLRSFERTSLSITSSVNKALATFGVGFSAAIVVRQLKDVVDQADQMGKLSQSTGVAVEQLSALSYAADLSGVSTEKLGTALGRLSVNISDTLRGTGEAKEAFAALGLTADQLRGKRPDEVLKAIADKFASFEDGTNKSAIAIRIFGRAGAELIPLLNSGSQGIARMESEARALGIVIDNDLAKSSERFNDQMAALSKSFDGFKIAIANSILPSLNSFSAAMLQAVKDASGFRGFMENWKAQGAGGPFADPKAVFSITALQDQLKFLQKEYEKTQAKLKEGFSISDTGEINIPAANTLYLDTLEKQITSVSGRIRDLQGLQSPINNVGKEILKLNNYWQLGALSTEEYIKRVREAAGVKIEAPEITGTRDKNAALIEQFNILESNKTATEKASDEILRQAAYWQAGITTVEQYGEAVRKAVGYKAVDPIDTSGSVGNQLSALAEFLKSREQIENEAFENRKRLVEQNVQDEEAQRRITEQLERVHAFNLLEIERDKNSQIMAMRENVLGLSVELLSNLGVRSKAFAIAAIALEKAYAVQKILVESQVAAMAALTPPPVGLGPVAGQALSARILAMGKASAGLVAAIGAVQIANQASGDTARGGGTSAGGASFSSPTAAPISSPQAQRVTQIYIQGDIIGSEEFVRKNLIPQIRQAVDNEDVILISGTSRQAREIAG